MSLMVVLALIATAVVIGLGCQVIGRSSTSYEWEIGSVGALYGELLGVGMLQTTLGGSFALAGVPIVPLLIGVATGGLMVLLFRVVGSPIPATRRSAPGVAPATCTRLVKLGFAAQLIQDAVIYRMRTRFGVSTQFVQAQITADQGWIELWISGSEPAVEAALGVAREYGIQVIASQPAGPVLVAA